MQNSKRQIALSSVLAILLYLVPNLVQDVHRVWGHHEQHILYQNYSGNQFHNQPEKCPVCVFEFNVLDETATFAHVPFPLTLVSSLVDSCDSQIQNKAFHYYNLRAPPQA